jgi:hypothetical protein
LPTKHIKKATYAALQQKLLKIYTMTKKPIKEVDFLDSVINKGLKAIEDEEFAENEFSK